MPGSCQRNLSTLVLVPFPSSCCQTLYAGERGTSLRLSTMYNTRFQYGHDRLYVRSSGFVISQDHPFLGASPDAAVYDPTEVDAFGLAEVKYSCHQLTPVEACSHANFCCALATNGNLTLQKDHVYYFQVMTSYKLWSFNAPACTLSSTCA